MKFIPCLFLSLLILRAWLSTPFPMAAQSGPVPGETTEARAPEPGTIQSYLVSLKPSYLDFQHAAYAGLVAIGASYETSERTFIFDLLYGYTPARVSGRDVHSIASKAHWRLFSIDLMGSYESSPMLGLGLIYSPDDDLFIFLPKQYPAWYYNPTAIRPAILAAWELRLQEKFSLSVEYALLDSELAYFQDSHKLNFKETGSFGFALRQKLD